MGKLIESPNDKWCEMFVQMIKSDLCPETDLSIVLQRQLSNPCSDYIIFNTEQLTRKSILPIVFKWSKGKHVKEIWDYSSENVKILLKHGITARLVPLKTSPELLEKVFKWNILKHPFFSVGFCGSMSPRRKHILDGLAKHGVKVNNVKAWGDNRDKELAKNTVILNVHFAPDYEIFEQSRCCIWLDAGYTVVSENSLDNDSRCINVAYEDIVTTILKLKNTNELL